MDTGKQGGAAGAAASVYAGAHAQHRCGCQLCRCGDGGGGAFARRRTRTSSSPLFARQCVRRGGPRGLTGADLPWVLARGEHARAASSENSASYSALGLPKTRPPALVLAITVTRAQRGYQRHMRWHAYRGLLGAPRTIAGLWRACACMQPERDVPSWRSGRLARDVRVLLTIEISQTQVSTKCALTPPMAMLTPFRILWNTMVQTPLWRGRQQK